VHAGGDDMKKLQLIAMFMCILVITLPICFSADYLEITKLSGKDDVWNNIEKKGYMGKRDHFTAVVTAERDDGAEITPAMLKLKIGTFEPNFDECTLIKDKRYNCTYTHEERSWTGNEFNTEIKLCSAENCVNQNAKLIVDDTGPIVQITQQPGQSGLNVTLQYSVTDKAYSGAPGTYCTGISRIEFYDGNTLIPYKQEIKSQECYLGNQQANFFMGGSGDKKITIKAYDNVGNAGQAAESEVFTLDHEEPEIVSGSFMLTYNGAKVNKISSEGMILSAEVKIESNDKGDNKLGEMVYADFSALSTDPLNKNVTGSCSSVSAGTYRCTWGNLNINKAGDASRIKIYATDSFGNPMTASPSGYAVTIENTAPAMHGTDFALIKNGKFLRGVSEIGGFADVYANFTDSYPGIDTENMYADLTGLNNDPNYARTPASTCQRHLVCTEVSGETCLGQIKDDYYACIWRDVFVKVSQTTTANIMFDVSDMFGNKNKPPIKQIWTVALDNTNPVIEHIGLGKEHALGNKNYLKPSADTDLVAVIEETGSGISDENVKFKYDGNDVSGNVNCTEKSGEWSCRVKQDTSGASGSKSISVSLSDDVGNAAAANSELIIDKDKPVLNWVKIYSQSPGFFRAGDEGFTIIANLTDASGFKNDNGDTTASADLSIVFTENYIDTPATDCIQSGAYWICKWEINDAIRAGARDAKIKFNFTDIAGNMLQHTETITISDTEDSEPDFYTISIDKNYIIPIEKYTIENIAGNYIEIVPFKVNPNGRCADAQIYDYKMAGDCSGSLVTMQKNDGSYSGFVQFEIDPNLNFDSTKSDYPISNCKLKFIVRCGNIIYNQYEKENFSISIPIVDEFKNPGDNIEQKVEGIKKDVSGWLYNTITTLDKWIGILQNVCAIKNMISSLFTMLDGLRLVGAILSKVPPLKAVGDAVFHSSSKGKSAIQKAWDTFVGYVNTLCGMVMCESPKSGGNFVLGGWCGYAKDALASSMNGKGAMIESYVMRTTPLELSKRSFIFSVACFCLPGITYNLNKLRQLKCWKGVCYRDYTASGIMTVADCEKQSSYDTCVYWTGQIAALGFPIENIIKLVADVVKNPIAYTVSYAWEIGKKVSKKTCDKAQDPLTAEGWILVGCIAHDVMLITEVVSSLEQSSKAITTMRWDGAQIDYCDQLFHPKTPGGAG
jgi:hypothetical protein